MIKTTWPSSCTLGYLFKRNEYLCSYKNLLRIAEDWNHPNALQHVNGGSVVYQYYGIFLSNKKEGSVDTTTWFHLPETHHHCQKVTYYMIPLLKYSLEITQFKNGEQISGCHWLGTNLGEDRKVCHKRAT